MATISDFNNIMDTHTVWRLKDMSHIDPAVIDRIGYNILLYYSNSAPLDPKTAQRITALVEDSSELVDLALSKGAIQIDNTKIYDK